MSDNMTTKIEQRKPATQTTGKSPNLGGPTNTYLDRSTIEINLGWAIRYEQLNDSDGGIE